MAIYSGFSHWKWWFSIVMLVYQRVHRTTEFCLFWFFLPQIQKRWSQPSPVTRVTNVTSTHQDSSLVSSPNDFPQLAHGCGDCEPQDGWCLPPLESGAAGLISTQWNNLHLISWRWWRWPDTNSANGSMFTYTFSILDYFGWLMSKMVKNDP